jgi:hypothetical protein
LFHITSSFWEISTIPTILNGSTPLPSQSNRKESVNGFSMSLPDQEYVDGITTDPSVPPLDHLGLIEDFHAPRFVVSQKHS